LPELPALIAESDEEEGGEISATAAVVTIARWLDGSSLVDCSCVGKSV
jgi:hypothetical protein